MTWVLAGLSLMGVWLNIKKKRLCFIVWSLTNIVWCIIDFKAGLPAQGCLFGVYFVLAVTGWFQWGRDGTS